MKKKKNKIKAAINMVLIFQTTMPASRPSPYHRYHHPATDGNLIRYYKKKAYFAHVAVHKLTVKNDSNQSRFNDSPQVRSML